MKPRLILWRPTYKANGAPALRIGSALVSDRTVLEIGAVHGMIDSKEDDAVPPPPEVVAPPSLFREHEDATGLHDRARHALPPSSPPTPSSSDPPTSISHRSDHIDLPSGSVINDEYEIERRLGAGAMGEVYAARHLRLGKRVAIKVMSPRISSDADAVERFEQEARTLAMIHHPGIVDVIGFGQLADSRSYFVMEYLPGESLEERIDRGRLPLDEALDILDQMARALEAAHAQQVVHRDLKPANTFLLGLIHSRGHTTRGGYSGEDGNEGTAHDACAAAIHG